MPGILIAHSVGYFADIHIIFHMDAFKIDFGRGAFPGGEINTYGSLLYPSVVLYREGFRVFFLHNHMRDIGIV